MTDIEASQDCTRPPDEERGRKNPDEAPTWAMEINQVAELINTNKSFLFDSVACPLMKCVFPLEVWHLRKTISLKWGFVVMDKSVKTVTCHC